MLGMTSKMHKHLLPLANRPMIRYPLEKLAKAGFDEAVVIIHESARPETKSLIDSLNLRMRVELDTVPDEEDFGTADSLRRLRDRINKSKAQNVLLMGCDIITTVSLQAMADVHRKHGATLTCLLRQASAEVAEGSVVPGPKSKRSPEVDFIGVDEEGSRILIYASEADFEDVFPVRLSTLKRHPLIELRTDLIDNHVYMMNAETAFGLLQQNPTIKSIRCELIPHLVKAQFVQSKVQQQVKNLNPDDDDMLSSHDTGAGSGGSLGERRSGDAAADNKLAALAFEMSSAGDAILATSHQQVRGCYAFYGDSEDICIRVNTVAAYMEANRLVLKHSDQFGVSSTGTQKHQHVGSDSLAADDLQLGEKSSIKKSVIGSHCRIGEKVKIINSVLMDGVTIKEGCTINGCIVGEHAEVQEKCDLKECIVGSTQTVFTLTKHANEDLTGIDKMIEI